MLEKNHNKYFIRTLTCWSRKYKYDCSTCWISRLNRHFDLQNDHLRRSPPCNTQTQQRKQDIRFPKSFCPAVIDAKSHELHIKMRQIYPVFKFGDTSIIPSMHCRTSSVSLGAVVFPAGQAFKNLHQTRARKCKNAKPKSWQNHLSSLF